MKYVYGCTADKSHPRQEVSHGMTEIIRINCPTCGGPTHKVPQAFRFGMRAQDILIDRLEENYRKNTYRRSLSR